MASHSRRSAFRSSTRRFSGAALLTASIALSAGAAHAVSFGATAWSQVHGNCRSQLTQQSTGGTLIDATQASATSTGAINVSPCTTRYLPGPWIGTSSSSASLSTGQLRVLASGSGSEAIGDLYPNGATLVNLQVIAQATFFDTFRLIPPSGYSGPNPIIDIILDVSYSISLGSGSALSNAVSLTWYLEVDTATTNPLRINRCDESGIVAGSGTCFLYGYPGSGRILHRIAVPIANPQVSLTALMFASVSNNATADASATGTLSFVLPAGFAIESDSTVLLTPEPELAILLGLGLGAVTLRRRGRSRSA